MLPDQANLAIYQGDDYAAIVTVLDASGAAFDLAGYKAIGHLRKGPANSNPEVMVEIATTINGNTVTLFIPAAVTITLTGRYLWDLHMIAPNGFITTILMGNADVTAEVTMPSLMTYTPG